MAEVEIRSLRQNASDVVARASGGETITITDRGRPVALVAPIPASPLHAMLASGRARAARRPIADLPRTSSSVPVASEVALHREDERY